MSFILDTAQLEDRGTVFAYIRETLGIKDYMGNNLDALEDVLGGFEGEIVINGAVREGGYAGRIIEVLKDAAKANGGITLTLRTEERAAVSGSRPAAENIHLRPRAVLRARRLGQRNAEK